MNIDEIKKIVAKWEEDSWTDGLSYECMVQIAGLVKDGEAQESKPGHWHFDASDPDFPRRWICPHCGRGQSYGQPPYCPWCGKRVLKEGE